MLAQGLPKINPSGAAFSKSSNPAFELNLKVGVFVETRPMTKQEIIEADQKKATRNRGFIQATKNPLNYIDAY